jgi:hypothetical protein
MWDKEKKVRISQTQTGSEIRFSEAFAYSLFQMIDKTTPLKQKISKVPYKIKDQGIRTPQSKHE